LDSVYSERGFVLKVRKAKLKDVERICYLNSLLNKCHEQIDPFYQLKPDPQHLHQLSNQHFQRMIRSRNAAVFVAEDQGNIVGYIDGTLRTNIPIFQIQALGRLGTIFVLEEYRRQGIGEALTEALFQWFNSKQVEYVHINSDIRNTVAVNAWKKYGFQEEMIRMRINLKEHLSSK
jgi:ribosomal protein S18 acetylase RimI-like enzyme